MKDKVAIVTGAGQGIGLAVCVKLAQAGVRVVLNDIDKALCEAAARQVNDVHSNACISYAGDSADLEVIKGMIDLAMEHFGGLDIVVANSGITYFGDFHAITEVDFDAVMRVNLKGTFFLCQQASEMMIKQGRGGSMVLMSSVVGHVAHKHLAAYSMTKAAIEMLAKNLVVELAPYQIRVNAVAPGATLTERTTEDAAYQKVWSTITPLGQAASVQDIAEAVYFFCSDAAQHITGQSLVIDGGWSSVAVQPA